MMNLSKEIEQLVQYFELDSKRIDRAAAVVERSHYHQTATETGITLIDQYYQQLRSHTVSATNYLNYRDALLSGTPSPV